MNENDRAKQPICVTKEPLIILHTPLHTLPLIAPPSGTGLRLSFREHSLFKTPFLKDYERLNHWRKNRNEFQNGSSESETRRELRVRTLLRPTRRRNGAVIDGGKERDEDTDNDDADDKDLEEDRDKDNNKD